MPFKRAVVDVVLEDLLVVALLVRHQNLPLHGPLPRREKNKNKARSEEKKREVTILCGVCDPRQRGW